MSKLTLSVLCIVGLMFSERAWAPEVFNEASDLPSSNERPSSSASTSASTSISTSTSTAPKGADSTSQAAADAANDGKTGDQRAADILKKAADAGKKLAAGGKVDQETLMGTLKNQ